MKGFLYKAHLCNLSKLKKFIILPLRGHNKAFDFSFKDVQPILMIFK